MIIQTPEPTPKKRSGIIGRLRAWFLTGVLVTAPVLLTVYITVWAIKLIDSNVKSLLPELAKYTTYGDYDFGSLPGIGLIIGVVLITVIGVFASGFLGRWIILFGEFILNHTPIVRTIYGAIKQILETVVSTQSNAFREVVLVEYPRRDCWVIGFVTGNTRGEVATRVKGQFVNIFVPTTPNPTSGFLLFCPRKDVISLKMGVEDAVKLVVSGGIVVPPVPSAKKAAVKGQPAKKAVSKGAAKKKAARKRAAG